LEEEDGDEGEKAECAAEEEDEVAADDEGEDAEWLKENEVFLWLTGGGDARADIIENGPS